MTQTTHSSHSVAANARGTSFKFGVLAACAGLAAFMAQDAEARGPRGGGGFRPGAAGLSFPNGGGQLGRFGANAPQRPSSLQRPGSGQARSGEAARQFGSSGQATRAGNAGAVNSGNQNARFAKGNGNTGAVNRGNGNGNTAYTRNGNTGVVGSGNVNTGNVNTAVNNGNVAIGNDVDVDVNGGWSNYPAGGGAAYATGVAVGATTTAAAASAYRYTLPAGCSPYAWSSYQYYMCSGTWYRQSYQGGTAVYVAVADPTKAK